MPMRGVKEQGRKAVLIAGDIGDSSFCKEVIKQTIKQFGRIDVLVNNASEQHRVVRLALPDVDSTDVNYEQWQPKFKVITEMLKHHIEEEEDDVFELAEEILDDESSSKLADDFKAAKEQTVLV